MSPAKARKVKGLKGKMSNEFAADLVERCVLAIAPAGGSEAIRDDIIAVLRASGYAELVAERDKWKLAYETECANFKRCWQRMFSP